MQKALIWLAVLFATPALANVDIALVGPMTGSEAAFGEQMKRGAEIAVDEINAHGGLNNQKINLIIEDDACDPKQAVLVANRIVTKGIKYVIGHWCTGATLVAAPIYAEEGVLEIDPAGLLPDTTKLNIPTMFRLSSTADYWGKVLADYAVKTSHPHKAFVIMDRRAVTQLFGSSIMEELKKADPNIQVQSISFEGGQRDFFTEISKMKEFSPDAVFLATYTLETALIVRQSQSLGAVKFYSWDTMSSPDFLNIVDSEQLPQDIFVNYSHPKNSAVLAKLDQQLDARGWPEEPYTFMVYAAFQLLSEDWQSAPGGKVTDLAQALHENDYETILGKIKFAGNGDNSSVKFSAYQWKESKPVELAPAN